MASSLTRRAMIAAPLALAACAKAESAPASGPAPPLRQVAPFPVGASITADQLGDPAAMALLIANFSQVTPGLEMKMEVVLREDGGFDFGKADAIAAFCRERGLRLHGHNLVWYTYRPQAFLRIAGDRAAFANA
jgi:endo-1,4-beta-xylanase